MDNRVGNSNPVLTRAEILRKNELKQAKWLALFGVVLLGLAALITFYEKLGNILEKGEEGEIDWDLIKYGAGSAELGAVLCFAGAVWNVGNPFKKKKSGMSEAEMNAVAALTAPGAPVLPSNEFVAEVEGICRKWDATSAPVRDTMLQFVVNYDHAHLDDAQKGRVQAALQPKIASMTPEQAEKLEPLYQHYPDVKQECILKVPGRLLFAHPEHFTIDIWIARCKAAVSSGQYDDESLTQMYMFSDNIPDDSGNNKKMLFWNGIMNDPELKPVFERLDLVKTDPIIVLFNLARSIEAELDIVAIPALIVRTINDEDRVNKQRNQDERVNLDSMFTMQNFVGLFSNLNAKNAYAAVHLFELELRLKQGKEERENFLNDYLNYINRLPQGENKKALCIALFSSPSLLAEVKDMMFGKTKSYDGWRRLLNNIAMSDDSGLAQQYVDSAGYKMKASPGGFELKKK